MKLADEVQYRKVAAGGPGSGRRPGVFQEGQKVSFDHPDYGRMTGHVTNAEMPTLAVAYKFNGKDQLAHIHHTKVIGAGGPGSGRHAMGTTLKQFGFKPRSKGGSVYQHSSKGHVVLHDVNDNWTHFGGNYPTHTGVERTGSGAASLKSHLQSK